MDLNLKNKNVLVTGSSRGIGLDIAKKFYKEGSRVALNSRKKLTKKILDEIPGAISIQGDVSNESSAKKIINECIQSFGSLDILVCNVGSGQSVRPGEENKDIWEQVFLQNFFSTTCMVEAAKPFLKHTKGVVICISSICGSESIKGAPVTYSVAKAALNAYVKGISWPLATDGVRICAISPGNIYFKGSVWSKKKRENPNEVKNMLEKEVPLNQFGSKEDISNLALFLASPLSNNTTGSIWISDGGQTKSF